MPQTPILALPYPADTDPADVPTDMQELAEAIETTFAGEAWIAPTLINGWTNYGLGTAPAGYFKDANGIVWLRGTISGGTIGQHAFVLPTGYRPPFTLSIGTASLNAFGQLNIFSDGSVNPAVGNSGAFALDGISFRSA